ncbi:MAG: flagellar biosynthesis protein FlgG, partial [Epulopiscium sp.]|nr:flagellar biosynthesis protein FlgG [Candidatus Epulonipiscium sp.]
MIRGLYTSATGMMAQYQKMDTITNNLANVNTTGYKKDEVITSSFQEELTKRINDISNYPLKSKAKNIGKMSLGVQVDEIFTNFTQGSLKETQDS